MGVIKLWGDGAISEWLGPFNSGETVSESHTWTEEVGAGTYERALNIAKKTLNNMGYPTSN
jgi:hypothetical protein